MKSFLYFPGPHSLIINTGTFLRLGYGLVLVSGLRVSADAGTLVMAVTPLASSHALSLEVCENMKRMGKDLAVA